MIDKLRNKTVLITGASKGIGRAIALLFSGYNMKIGLIARSEDKLKEVSNCVNSAGGEALILNTDLRDRKAIEDAVLEFKNKFGEPDFLINNAGIAARGFWQDISLDSELDVMNVNYTAAVILMRLLLPGMMQADSGHIINISAIAGIYTAPYQGAYCASKAALLAYSVSLGYELEKTNVKISSILFPGPVDTDFLKSPNFESFRKFKDIISPDLIAQSVLSVIENPKEMVFVGPLWKLIAAKIASLKPEFFRKIIEKKNTPPESLDVFK
ncbi:SDR family NAD(P)-dependent oxidoreductase [bacterium]|nr:SDR family NAD(P)-dependent oxidoreductase [bacterium]